MAIIENTLCYILEILLVICAGKVIFYIAIHKKGVSRMDDGKLTEQEKAERFQKAVYFFIGFSIFVFILCLVAIIN